ncbi:MAG: C39 family peptidase [Candidatus Moraniibacteriota bacterium]
MKKILFILFLTLFFLLISFLFFEETSEHQKISQTPSTEEETAAPREKSEKVNDNNKDNQEEDREDKKKENEDNQKSLPSYHLNEVPFFPQSPFAKWDPLHEEACEEAAIIMSHLYLSDKEEISLEEADKEIREIIAYEEEELGFGEDINAEQMIKLTEEFYGHKLTTLKDYENETIKRHLARGNIFIAPAAGRVLENPNFQAPGPLYHALIITGYDDEAKQFITNDPGTRRGENFKYSYQNLLESIHDFPENGKKENILQGEKVLILVKKNKE